MRSTVGSLLQRWQPLLDCLQRVMARRVTRACWRMVTIVAVVKVWSKGSGVQHPDIAAPACIRTSALAVSEFWLMWTDRCHELREPHQSGDAEACCF
jgi:hypothetical protein